MSTIRYGELAGYLADGKDFILELGEQTGIGSSSLLIRKCGLTGLIDRGISFEGFGTDKVTTFPVGDNLEDIHIDYMIFTHAHADHVGLIVPTILAHPESRVFFSRKTLDMLKIILADTLSVQQKAINAAYHSGSPDPVPLFTKEEAARFLVNSEDENGPYEIIDTDSEDTWITFENWPGWEFGFTFSGHMVGSFISLIKCPDGDGFVITGDVSGHDQETTQGVKTLREDFLEAADFRNCRRIIMITEATNGNRDRIETQEESDARLKAVLKETELRGGKALFPVFMVNRGPNIVKKLVRLGFKVFVAGGVRKTLAIEVGSELVAKWRAEKTVMFIEDGINYMAMLQAATRGEYGFRPIVTSSATVDQGAVVEMAINMLPVPENILISTGHVFDGSAMQEFFRIKNQPIGIGQTIVLNKMINKRPVKTPVNVRCRGEHFDYSAHSYRSELVALITGIKPDVIFVKHCMDTGFNGLKSALQNSLGDACPAIERVGHLKMHSL